jgi:Uri superfamily endonuclease
METGQFRVTTMELPEEKGTYILIVSVSQMKRIDVGRLGAFELVPGFYAYVGSAFGTGGLRARIGHHLESTTAPHWHIDYLLRAARPIEIWYTIAPRKLERRWAALLEKTPGFTVPIPRFGCSDFRGNRSSHLFHSEHRPSFRSFKHRIEPPDTSR